MFELIAKSKFGIYAVPYQDRRRLATVNIPSGAIVEAVPPEMAEDLRRLTPANFEVPGIADVFLGQTGMFRLPDGKVGVVYGADAERIGL